MSAKMKKRVAALVVLAALVAGGILVYTRPRSIYALLPSPAPYTLHMATQAYIADPGGQSVTAHFSSFIPPSEQPHARLLTELEDIRARRWLTGLFYTGAEAEADTLVIRFGEPLGADSHRLDYSLVLHDDVLSISGGGAVRVCTVEDGERVRERLLALAVEWAQEYPFSTPG